MKNIFLFTFIFLLFGIQNAFACMCGATSVCEAYGFAESVVVAEVKKFKKTKIPLDYIFRDEKNDKFEEGQEVLLEVEKNYKGERLNEIKLLQPNSTCDWIFSQKDIGKKFLFYLEYDKKYKRYRVPMCGRGMPIEKASVDLSWLNALPESLERTLIYGKVSLKEDRYKYLPFENFNLEIKGQSKTYTLSTDKAGNYKIWDVPVGQYYVNPILPHQYQLAWTVSMPENWLYFWNPEKDIKALEVTINQANCGGVDFMIEKKDEK